MQPDNKTNTIRVVEKQSQEVLFETTPDNAEAAYLEAVNFEQMGLDIEIISPSVTESLARSLGVSDEQLRILDRVLEQEIESHNDSCAHSLRNDDHSDNSN